MLLKGELIRDWNFKLENVKEVLNPSYKLEFYNDYGQSFNYYFRSINEFKEAYKKQEISLFKRFFNDDTIELAFIEIEFNSKEWEQIFIETKEVTPTFYYEYLENYSNCTKERIIQIITDSFNYPSPYEKLSLLDLLELMENFLFNTPCENIVELYDFYLELDELTPRQIYQLDKEGVLNIIDYDIGFNEQEKQFIDASIEFIKQSKEA